MRKVRLFCDWDNDSDQLIQRLMAQTKGMSSYEYKDIEFVSDNSYDHAVAFNFPIHSYVTSSEKNFGLLLEPPEIYDRLPQYIGWRDGNNPGIGKMYSFCYNGSYEPALGLGFATAPLNQWYPDNKDKQYKCCMIVSNKVMTPWHAKRHEIKEALLETDLDIHFYGRGLSGTDSRIRGEIGPMAKHTVLQNYKFCIDFENSSQGAVTDKFFDPIICNTVPITNTLELFDIVPDGSFEFVGFSSVDRAVAAIKQILERYDIFEYQTEIDKTKERITQGELNMVEWIYQRVMER